MSADSPNFPDHEQAQRFAHAIAGGIAAAVMPLKDQLAALEVRVSNLENAHPAPPINAGRTVRNTTIDPDYVNRLINAPDDSGENLPAEPLPEPEPRPLEAKFTKGMMKGSQVYIARALLPNNEGVITYKRGDLHGYPSIILERPDGVKIKYLPTSKDPEVEG
jgi:hypothetical protein